MFLPHIVPKNIKEEILNSIPKEEITIYKVVNRPSIEEFYPLFLHKDYPFKNGVNKAIQEKVVFYEYAPMTLNTIITENDVVDLKNCQMLKQTSYLSGFHSFLNEEDAIEYRKYLSLFPNACIIQCIVKKEWITSIGYEVIKEKECMVIVSDKLIFNKKVSLLKQIWAKINFLRKKNKPKG